MPRPKKPPKDANHNDVLWVLKNRLGGYTRSKFVNEKGQPIKGAHVAHLRGLRVVAYDTADMGGEMLDWLVLVSWFPLFLEVKAERVVKNENLQTLTDAQYYRTQLQIGETIFMDNCPAVSRIVYNTDQIYDLLDKAADFVFWVEDDAPNNAPLDIFFPKRSNDEEQPD